MMNCSIQIRTRVRIVLLLAAYWSLGCATIDSTPEGNYEKDSLSTQTDTDPSGTGDTDSVENASDTSDEYETGTTIDSDSYSDTMYDLDTSLSSDTNTMADTEVDTEYDSETETMLDTGSTSDVLDTDDSDVNDTNDEVTETDSGGDSDSSSAEPTDDECPADPYKESPGQCGCGIPDTDVGNTAGCVGLIDALIHRYRFSGTGMTIIDSIGSANGTSNVELSDDGTLSLSGGSSGDHVALPSGILSSFSSVTIEFWTTWYGGDDSQRLLSFGTAEPTKPDKTKCTGSASYYNGSWYEFCNGQKAAWSTARRVCEDAGGHLVEIESAEEDEYISTHPDFTQTPWIGANDLTSEGEWYFAKSDGLQAGVHIWSGDENGSAPEGVYENWRRDNPEPKDADANADCAFIYKLSPPVWMAYNCYTAGAFICEWRGQQGSSTNRGVWFTPADDIGLPSLTFKAGTTEAVAQATTAFPSAAEAHVALVLDPANSDISLFINGTLVASVANNSPLADLRDADNWLGLSHVIGNSTLNGTLSEFRIYNQALTPEQIATSYFAGPDPEFLEP